MRSTPFTFLSMSSLDKVTTKGVNDPVCSVCDLLLFISMKVLLSSMKEDGSI